MQIRELHIDGFGIFHNATLKNLHSGINILYGSNEFGKTTILEFIRRILFGFPKRKSAGINLYLPQKGGEHGGHLVCELANGEIVNVRRTSGPNGGSVTIVEGSKSIQGQSSLSSLLGHASSDLFHNIFAFSLDELQAMGSLQGEEVKNRIYGAGLGLGPDILVETEKHFKDLCEDRFKIRGKNQKLQIIFEAMSRLQQSIQSVQKELSCYDELRDQTNRLESKKKLLNNRIHDLETHRRQLETLADLYPVYVELEGANEEINSLEIPSNLPKDAPQILGRTKTEIHNLKLRIGEEEEIYKNFKVEIEHIHVDEKILTYQEDIVALRNMTEQIRSALKDQIILGEKRERLDIEIQSDIRKIGKSWNENVVTDFQLTSTETSYVQTQRELFDECRQKLSLAKGRLGEHREEKARVQSQIFRPPEWFQIASYSLTGAAFLGLLAGSIWFNWPVLIFSIILLVLGGISLSMVIKIRSTLTQPDEVGPILEKRVLELEKEQDQLYQNWRNWLHGKELDIYFSPVQAEKTFASIKGIQNQLAQRTELDQRLENMRTAIKKAGGIIKYIHPQQEIVQDHLLETIEKLCSVFEDSTRNREKKNTLRVQLEALSEKIVRLKKQVEETLKTEDEFVRSLGVDSLEGFEEQCRRFERSEALKALSKDKQNFIQSRIGLGHLYDKFLGTLRETNPDKIQLDLEATAQSLSEAHSERDKLNQETGELRMRLGQLDSDEKLSKLRMDFEINKTKLNLTAKEWATAKIAGAMLERTKRKYERERQPEVLRAAQDYFSLITDDRYRKIYFSLDSEEIQIETEKAGLKLPAEMSRGTREQLYLALRLGLIEHYESRSEPLPVVMDDVLVNFDDGREMKVMEILKRFSEKRQVIIFSCHQKALETYQRFGAQTISL